MKPRLIGQIALEVEVADRHLESVDGERETPWRHAGHDPSRLVAYGDRDHHRVDARPVPDTERLPGTLPMQIPKQDQAERSLGGRVTRRFRRRQAGASRYSRTPARPRRGIRSRGSSVEEGGALNRGRCAEPGSSWQKKGGRTDHRSPSPTPSPGATNLFHRCRGRDLEPRPPLRRAAASSPHIFSRGLPQCQG